MTDPMLLSLATVALLAAPGPTNTLLAIAGAQRKNAMAFGLAAVVAAAYLIAIGFYRLALAPLLLAFPPLGLALRVAVALYVAWLAIRLWRTNTAMDVRPIGAREVFVTTLLNPKALIAAITLIPAAWPEMAWAAAAFGAVAAASSLGWLLLGSAIAAAAGRHVHALPRIGSVVLAGFAGVIAASVLG